MTAFEWKTFFCLESHIHLCSRHTSANPAYVIKTCLGWHAISKARYWGFVSPKLHVSTYRNQQHCWWFHNYEKYPLSPLKPRSLAFIEQYLPNISDTVYSVHQSFMWFLWLNWRKSTFYPITAPNDSKCWPIVTSSIQEPAASHCDVIMTVGFRVGSMEAFLAQWCWWEWFNEFVKTSLCQVFQNLWSREMFGKWRHD